MASPAKIVPCRATLKENSLKEPRGRKETDLRCFGTADIRPGKSTPIGLKLVNFNGVSRRLGANQEPIYISSESPRTHLSIAVKIFPIRESYNDIQEEFWNHAQGEEDNIPVPMCII
ncbi:unnamed protein product [Microthlaspi erraticum]|uniref:Uncharacterized protein n=1 Tax=Microthlaspi erraticum TaxID=1685480 RepID=A0A6D2IDX8_9BRAS|nr:unnamed protein product [Microthlaspi erraticum]